MVQQTAEGGDLLVLGRGAVLVGMSERTTPQGVERLATRLFEAGSAQTVVALSMLLGGVRSLATTDSADMIDDAIDAVDQILARLRAAVLHAAER